MEIGLKVKRLRKKLNLSQQELADRAELSKGFISQVENDKTSISLDALEILVEALGQSMSEFFKDNKDTRYIFNREDASISKEEGHTIEFIVPNTQKNYLQPVVITVEPQGKSYIYEPFEGELFGYLCDGEVDFYYGDDIKEFKSGDSIFIKGQRRFQFKNKTNKSACIILVADGMDF